ncbi:alpha/beta hydrolase, partial [Carnobacterium sp.]|uniref:alpha/beta fold hydrolase n=1 Tax=Carnobacterium sp. TaxID=48221 RepID=UPI00338E8239
MSRWKPTVYFIQVLRLNKVHILGLSMGGMVAQEIVLSHPKLVEKLVLVGTGPKGGQGIGRV